LDTDTHESLLDIPLFVYTIQNRQNVRIAYLGELAFRKGFILDQ